MEPNDGGNKLPTQPNPPNPPQMPPQPPYDYVSVHPFEIKYSNGQQEPYEPMRIPVATQFFEKFCIPNDMDPTVQVISELFPSRIIPCKGYEALKPLWESQGELIQAHFRSLHFGLLQHHLLHGNCLTSIED